MSARASLWSLRLGAVGAAAAALAVLPFLIGQYYAFEFAGMGAYFVAILGLNILTGYTGQISIGHGAFMSIGAYTTVILAERHGFPDWSTIPLGAAKG